VVHPLHRDQGTVGEHQTMALMRLSCSDRREIAGQNREEEIEGLRRCPLLSTELEPDEMVLVAEQEMTWIEWIGKAGQQARWFGLEGREL
jgi:hypothetical protein